jgi:hypothetical protein
MLVPGLRQATLAEHMISHILSIPSCDALNLRPLVKIIGNLFERGSRPLTSCVLAGRMDNDVDIERPAKLESSIATLQ